VTPIGGVSLSEANVTAGEMFTVTLTDATGLLSATGTGVSGSGTTALTITGSFSQVNAALATLADKEAAPGVDTLTLKATDSNGGTATPGAIAVTTNGPVISVPNAKFISVNHATAITGIRLSLVGTPGKGETLTATLKDANGLLSATGMGISGSGTTTLILTGTLGQVNADLSTLQDTNAVIGKDGIRVTVVDSLGETATPATASVTVNGAPVIAAPASASVALGKATSIAGVSLSEAGTTTKETFTVVLTDTNGKLSATGKGITGSGTTTLTITGKLSQVNADLATLKDTDTVAGADTITLNATDSLGGAAAPVAIAVNAAGAHPPGAPAFVAAMAGLGAGVGAASALSAPPPQATPPWRQLIATGGHSALA
jgi:hypothetical protein